MGDVLEQSEVDALLAAVDTGSVAGGDGRGGDGASEVFGRHGRAQTSVQTYDFKRPERVSKDQMRALEALHEGFGRNFGAALSGYLRTIIEVNVAHTEQLTYSEFIHSLPNPTCFNLLKADQLDGQLCLEISPLIIYPIIDRLLGGSNADLFIPQRPLTQIEQRLVQRITDRATQFLSEAWSNLTPVTLSVTDFESNPQLVQIVPPNETVVVVGFELRMGNRAGTMSLCIPYNVIEPIMGTLAAQSWFTYQRRGPQDDSLKRLSKSVSGAPVEMRAVLAKTSMSVNDLMNLQVGDLITTDRSVSSEIVLQVEGRPKFHGKLGAFRQNRAVQITRVAKEPIDPNQPMPLTSAATPAATPSPAAGASKPAAAVAGGKR